MKSERSASYFWPPHLRLSRAVRGRGDPGYHIEIIVFRANSAQGAPRTGARKAVSTTPWVRNRPRPTRHRLDIHQYARARPVPTDRPGDQAALDWRVRSSRSCRVGTDSEHVGNARRLSAAEAWSGCAGLNGTVYLERGQYLHLGMALSYAIASPPAGLGAGLEPPSR